MGGVGRCCRGHVTSPAVATPVYSDGRRLIKYRGSQVGVPKATMSVTLPLGVGMNERARQILSRGGFRRLQALARSHGLRQIGSEEALVSSVTNCSSTLFQEDLAKLLIELMWFGRKEVTLYKAPLAQIDRLLSAKISVEPKIASSWLNLAPGDFRRPTVVRVVERPGRVRILIADSRSQKVREELPITALKEEHRRGRTEAKVVVTVESDVVSFASIEADKHRGLVVVSVDDFAVATAPTNDSFRNYAQMAVSALTGSQGLAADLF